MACIIREATIEDLQFLVDFNVSLAWESEHKVLERGVVEQGVRALLQDSTKGRYFVAEDRGNVVGQVMITYEWSDWRNAWIWWLQSVYISPRYRRQGVFRALLRHVEWEARRRHDVAGLRLYVEENNHPAQAAYSQCGFRFDPFRFMSRDIDRQASRD